MGIEQFIERFGSLTGLGIYILLKEIWPWLRDKYFPAKMKAEEVKRDAEIRAEEEARKIADEDRKARLNEQADERKWHREQEAERLSEMRVIREAVQALNVNAAQTSTVLTAVLSNQRVILDKQDNHHNQMMEAVSDMRESVARRNGIEAGKKLPKTSPLGEKTE